MGKIRKVCHKSFSPIILLTGGHGFKILEDTKMIEVKQGPYLNQAEDKEWL